MEALRGIPAAMIFEAMKIFKKDNFRHGFTSWVNGIATFPFGQVGTGSSSRTLNRSA
jgi:hypothetical protein